jgi:inner membrane transporter RhtA
MGVREDGPSPNVILPLVATTGAMACFQIGAALAKGLFPIVGAQGAATLRLSLGSVMLLVLVRPWRRWPNPAPVAALIGLGVSTAASIVFFYLALERLPLGVTIPLQFMGPLAVAVATSRRTRDFVWVAAAAAGVWALVGSRTVASKIDLLGIGYALAAGAGWAGYILLGKAASLGFGRSTAALASSIAALVTLPIGVVHAGAALLSPALLPLALLVAAVSAALPLSLELYALPRLPSRTFATWTSVEPAFAGLAGLVFLGERLTAIQWSGIGLVIVAAAGTAWSSGARPENQSPAP